MINALDEIILQKILLDAAAQEFAGELDSTDQVDVSPRFQREMKRMLSNPTRWANNRVRPLWKRWLQKAAILVLICILSFGTFMALNPTASAAFIRLVTEWYETHILYRMSGEPDSGALPLYQITSLPPGFDPIGTVSELPNDTEILYESELGELIRLDYSRVQAGTAVAIFTGNVVISEINVNGNDGHLYLSTDPEQSNGIVWYDKEANLFFLIDGFYGERELLQMAESVILLEK